MGCRRPVRIAGHLCQPTRSGGDFCSRLRYLCRRCAALWRVPELRMVLRSGGYCKAYPVGMFREFSDWAAHASRRYTDDHVLYLQPDYSVTDGVYENQNVVFNVQSEEWVEFCRQKLKFPSA